MSEHSEKVRLWETPDTKWVPLVLRMKRQVLSSLRSGSNWVQQQSNPFKVRSSRPRLQF